MDDVQQMISRHLRPGSLAERAVEVVGAVLSTVGYLLGPVCVLIAAGLISCVVSQEVAQIVHSLTLRFQVWVYFTLLFPYHCPELFSIWV